ncbi:hypothetical protein BH10ACI2_BH10ACI2_17890 [soil metagenome]
MYEIRLLDEAAENLAKLDRSVAQRIFRKLTWLAQNAAVVAPRGLRKELSGLARIREGDHRAVYEVNHEDKTIIVRFIGHRSEVYKR